MRLNSLFLRTIGFVITLQFLVPMAFGTDDPRFLGDLGVDPQAARAKLRDRKAQRVRWELATTVEEYDRIGTKNPRWDADVRDALTREAKFLAGDCTDCTNCEDELKAAFQKVLAAGCNDPLVVYIGIRLGLHSPEISGLELAKLLATAEGQLQKSEYPAIRKCFASVRAAEQAMKVVNTINGPERLELTKSIPALLGRAEAKFEDVLRDQSANRDSVYDLSEKAFLDVARDTPHGQQQVFDPLVKFFETNKARITGDKAGAGLIEGNFWIQAAWAARGTGWSSSVTQEGGRLFEERLQKAQMILEKAWAADASDPNIALQMMTVELGQGLGRERLEMWFRRAMDADPDSCEAAQKKLLYLEPRWYGTEKDVLKFAHQCFDTGNWESRIPFVLISAHSDLAYLSEHSNQYWKRPEVWNDVEKFYNAYLARNPKSTCDRSHYALTAFHAEKWKVADELFATLGDKPDLEAMKCSMAQYNRMRQFAAIKAKTE